MRFRSLVLLSLLITTTLVIAADSQQSTSNILFPTYTLIKPLPNKSSKQYNTGEVMLSLDFEGKDIGVMLINGLKGISAEAIADINSLGNMLCKQIKNSDIKVWLSLGAEGKLIVGASGQAGMEVTFHCKK